MRCGQAWAEALAEAQAQAEAQAKAAAEQQRLKKEPIINSPVR